MSTALDTPGRQPLLDLALASPSLADAHDKTGWLALYADDAVVADPVGTPASHAGRRPGRLGDELGRFYEAFIAPSSIRMEAGRDIVCGMAVFRSVIIHTTELKTGLGMQVPACLLYEMTQTPDGLRIRRMHAHWELNRMSRILLAQGMPGYRAVATMNRNMLRAFGPRWLFRYFAASRRGIGREGKERLEQWCGRLGRSGSDTLTDMPGIEVPGVGRVGAGEFSERCNGIRPEKLLASGYTVSGLAAIDWDGRERQGALIAEFVRPDGALTALRLFWDEEAAD